MYGIGCITLAFIYDVGVDLGSFYVCMSKHSLDGIDIRVMFKLQGGEGVTETMEGDFLFDTSTLHPSLYGLIYP